ncbi:MAG: MvaI/BcnI restriction endonuclease family protein [Lactobacillus sp.]|nr:MAG: MvaI/BcnI restriction endonuclease family protein [Lactobacillus sp.]
MVPNTRDDDLFLLQNRLKEIKDAGWIENTSRQNNQGRAGNLLEDLLSVVENNLALPDFRSWELKTSRRKESTALVTLFHCEPEPRSAKIVPNLLRNYGWPHQEAGLKYPSTEKSFRSTTFANRYTDRGMTIKIDRKQQKVFFVFDPEQLKSQQQLWKKQLTVNGCCVPFNPVPFWTFQTIQDKLAKKLKNTILMQVSSKKENDKEFFDYKEFKAYINPSVEKLLKLLETGGMAIDFDARTGHNHGTKFRIKKNLMLDLYEKAITV